MEYLLFLQNIRNSLGGLFNEFFQFITTVAVDYYIILIPLIIYWAIDKKKGFFIYCTHGISCALNAFIKSTFCVYRPWIRDSRIKPLESVLSGATGYSFPSGHSSSASSIYFPLANKYKKNKGLIVFCIVMVFLTMFSRTYVGVHTLQDVIVGCLVGVCSLIICAAVQKYIEKNPNKDTLVFVVGIILTVLLLIYVYYKNYPEDYVNGVLLVDPKSMKINSFKDPGTFFGVMLAWYIERRFVKIDITGSIQQKIMRCVIGALLVVAYYSIIVNAVGKMININIIYFLLRASTPVVFMILYPLTWKKH